MIGRSRGCWLASAVLACGLTAGCMGVSVSGPSGPNGNCSAEEQQFYDLTLQLLEACDITDAQNVDSCASFITAQQVVYGSAAPGSNIPDTFAEYMADSIAVVQDYIDTERCP